MMMGITEKLLQIHGKRGLYDKCVPLRLLLQECLLQHEGPHLKETPAIPPQATYSEVQIIVLC